MLPQVRQDSLLVTFHLVGHVDRAAAPAPVDSEWKVLRADTETAPGRPLPQLRQILGQTIHAANELLAVFGNPITGVVRLRFRILAVGPGLHRFPRSGLSTLAVEKPG